MNLVLIPLKKLNATEMVTVSNCANAMWSSIVSYTRQVISDFL